jgi:hypothetical protein
MTPSVPQPNYEPTKEERIANRQAKKDRIAAIQENVQQETRAFNQVYGARSILSGSPLSLR